VAPRLVPFGRAGYPFWTIRNVSPPRPRIQKEPARYASRPKRERTWSRSAGAAEALFGRQTVGAVVPGAQPGRSRLAAQKWLVSDVGGKESPICRTHATSCTKSLSADRVLRCKAGDRMKALSPSLADLPDSLARCPRTRPNTPSRWSVGDGALMSLSARSDTIPGPGCCSNRSNASGARSRMLSTCVTRARETPSRRARSALDSPCPTIIACHSRARCTGLRLGGSGGRAAHGPAVCPPNQTNVAPRQMPASCCSRP